LLDFVALEGGGSGGGLGGFWGGKGRAGLDGAAFDSLLSCLFFLLCLLVLFPALPLAVKGAKEVVTLLGWEEAVFTMTEHRISGRVSKSLLYTLCRA